MSRRKRPPTLWLAHCAERVTASFKKRGKRISADSAIKICAGNWWHAMKPRAKRKAVRRHEP